MSEQQTVQAGVWCHIEIPSSDNAKSKAFYSGTFGWKFTDVPTGDSTYSLYETREGGIGGGVFTPPPGMPKHMINYVNVDDIESTCATAEKKGGKVVMAKQEVPGPGGAAIGWFSLIADPDGNVFGIWKQGEGPH